VSPGSLPRLLVVVHEDHAGLGRLGSLGAEIDERRPDRGDPLPPDLAGHVGLVVLGGSMACWEDEGAPWLPATRRLLASGVEAAVPTLGICLGAQLLALATGGRVERGARGLEVGLVDVDLLHAAESDALLAPVLSAFGRRVSVPQWHQDAITELPGGAIRLAGGDRYPYQAFRLGERAWGLQYHPEVSVGDWQDWMEDGHGAVRTEGLHPDDVTAQMVSAELHLAALAAVHASAFSSIVAATAAAR
jgi:GMP synthase-like glutamine amidotransferase